VSAAGPSIGVIVPNRNDARYLRRCLGSVLNQEVRPDELIVIDDQSTDDSVAVIRAAVAGHAFARLIQNPRNLGTYGAVDEGLKCSSSEYVLFLASNDFVLPGVFARARACLQRAPGAGLWSALAWFVDEQDRLLRLHPSPVVALRDTYFEPRRCIEFARRLGNWFTGTTLIYRRSAVDEAGRFDPAFMGLSDLFTALIVASRHGAAYSPAPYAAIRKHGGSYLERTLSEPDRLEHILKGVFEHGLRHAPLLFTRDFVERTTRRFRSASVRTTRGRTLAAVAQLSPGWVGRALRLIEHLVPRSWGMVRVVLGFLVLRPFDVLPSMWYRGLGWLYVRARFRWPG
jgi:glycosyltransferase involved in cell wall biosynthesis